MKDMESFGWTSDVAGEGQLELGLFINLFIIIFVLMFWCLNFLF